MALKITKLMPRKGLAEINNKMVVGPVDDMVYIAQRALLEEQGSLLKDDKQDDDTWEEFVMRHSAIHS